jgi:two-component system phosphate regulon response regulator OmpR
MNRILLVEDHAAMRELVVRELQHAGIAADAVGRVREAEACLTQVRYAALVLDRGLPDGDALPWLQRLRERQVLIPCLLLTARDALHDRVDGLEAGADDYLAKPFNPRELLARIHAVLRRRPATEVPGAPSSEQEVARFGPFTFDMGLRTLHKDGQELPLTTGEFAMLKTLVRHPRLPLSREKLAQLARGREFEPFDRSLDVQVSRLRKLIEADAAAPRYIQTVWGVGYVFVPDGAG